MIPKYAPMIPTQVRQSFHREGWVYEEKIDGWRMLAYKDGRTVRRVSRNERDQTCRFRDLAAAIAKLFGRTLVLDGEVAIFDQQVPVPLRVAPRSRPGRCRLAPSPDDVRPQNAFFTPVELAHVIVTAAT